MLCDFDESVGFEVPVCAEVDAFFSCAEVDVRIKHGGGSQTVVFAPSLLRDSIARDDDVCVLSLSLSLLG